MGGHYSDRLVIIWSAFGPRDDTKQGKTARDDAKPKPLQSKACQRQRHTELDRQNTCKEKVIGSNPIPGSGLHLVGRDRLSTMVSLSSGGLPMHCPATGVYSPGPLIFATMRLAHRSEPTAFGW